MSPFIRWSNEISITSTVKLHKASSLNVYWKSAQYTVSRDVPWNTCEGQWLNWFNLLPSLLIKNFVVGHVIVRLDYTVTENGTGCLDINIKPQFLFFPLPEGSSNSSLSLFHTLQSKMRLIRETRLMVWEPREESRAIMQPRLTVTDSWCNRKERDGWLKDKHGVSHFRARPYGLSCPFKESNVALINIPNQFFVFVCLSLWVISPLFFTDTKTKAEVIVLTGLLAQWLPT